MTAHVLTPEAVLHHEALVVATTAQGFSREVALAGLTAEVDAWRPEALASLMSELPSPTLGRRPARVLIIAARTLAASALRQCYLARALGAAVHLKSAAGQEALATALNALDPAITPAAFDRDDARAVAAAIAAVDTVVVLGSDETVAAVRAATPPDKGFAPHGHKVSAAWLGAAPDDAAIAGLAADLLAWDQAGCLAPQVVWVEGGTARCREVAQRIADVVRTLESGLPLAALAAHRAARLRTAPLVAMLGGDAFTSETSFVGTLADASFRMSPGPRMLWVLPADRRALAEVEPMLSTLASDVAIDLPPAVRFCRPGEMQRPPLGWHQDGLHPLASLFAPGST